MAEIIKYKNSRFWTVMILQLDLGEKLPDEIRVLINDMIISYKRT